MNQMQSLLKAEEEIKPYLATFKGCYERAMTGYNKALEVLSVPVYNRTKAIVFHNAIVNEIKAAFTDVEEVGISEKYESISLVIDNHISARFKKLNGRGFPSNHRSKRNDAIISQQLELGFVDYPPIARIDVCYSLDITGTSFEQLKVICRKGDDIIWDLYFHDAEGDSSTLDFSIPEEVRPIQPVRPAADRRVQPKEKKKDKKAE